MRCDKVFGGRLLSALLARQVAEDKVREGKVVGKIMPTGIRPRFLEKLQQNGINLPPSVFGFSGRQTGA